MVKQKCGCELQLRGCDPTRQGCLRYKGDTSANKELPQEVVNAFKGYSIGKIYLEKGAQIAQSHYLKELTAKDSTIKEQAEKIEKLTGLLKEAVTKGRFPLHAEPAWNNYKEQHGI